MGSFLSFPLYAREAHDAKMVDACLRGDLYAAKFAAFERPESATQRALLAACRGGDGRTTKFVALHVLQHDPEHSRALEALEEACIHDNINAAISVADVSRIKGYHLCVNNFAALQWACLKRRHCVVRWLVRRFELDADDAHQAGALEAACKGGNVRLVKWLAHRFGYTSEYVKCDDNAAMRAACAYGNLEVAQYLADTFGLTYADASALHNEALRTACTFGHLEVAQWLVKRFGLTKTDAQSAQCEALRGACINGRVGVARWLVHRFNLGKKDAQAIGNYALHGACENGHAPMVRWLLSKFPHMTSTDAESSYAVRDAEVAEVIRAHFEHRRAQEKKMLGGRSRECCTVS